MVPIPAWRGPWAVSNSAHWTKFHRIWDMYSSTNINSILFLMNKKTLKHTQNIHNILLLSFKMVMFLL
jgi:hypothetical protein